MNTFLPVYRLKSDDSLPDLGVLLPDDVASVGRLDGDGRSLHAGEALPGKVAADIALQFEHLNLENKIMVCKSS